MSTRCVACYLDVWRFLLLALTSCAKRGGQGADVSVSGDIAVYLGEKKIGQNAFGEGREWLYIQSKQKKGWI